jgi:hypothetical protein
VGQIDAKEEKMKRVLALGMGLMLVAGLMMGCGEAAKKKAMQLAFKAACKAQSNEPWMEETCNCVANKAVAEFTLEQM